MADNENACPSCGWNGIASAPPPPVLPKTKQGLAVLDEPVYLAFIYFSLAGLGLILDAQDIFKDAIVTSGYFCAAEVFLVACLWRYQSSRALWVMFILSFYIVSIALPTFLLGILASFMGCR